MAELALAYPSKGRLRPQADACLSAAGMPVCSVGGGRSYDFGLAGEDAVRLLLAEAAQIPGLLARGEAHCGITGVDLVQERLQAPSDVLEMPIPLGFGAARIAFAVPACWVDVDSMADLEDVAFAFLRRHRRPLRLATGFRRLVSRFLTERFGAPLELVPSRGPTEAAPLAGLAELIVDIVASGNSLRANHLKVPEEGVILESQACFWVSRTASWTNRTRETLDRISGKLHGSVVGRDVGAPAGKLANG